jgi:hypothetical protein
MAHGARRLVELKFAGTVQIGEMLGVAGRPQGSVFGVTILATERHLDLGMADEAIGHLREVRMSHLVRFFQPAVARFARISCMEMLPDVPGRLEVILMIDRARNVARDIAHAKVQRMAELRQRHWSRIRMARRDLGVFMAVETDLLRG